MKNSEARKEILKTFEVPPAKLGVTKPFDEKEYRKVIRKLEKVLLTAPRKELRKLLKEKGLPLDSVSIGFNPTCDPGLDNVHLDLENMLEGNFRAKIK